MRLSVWQQFSSNHSAHYLVVGQFESSSQADIVAKKLKEITLQIRETTPQPYELANQQGFNVTQAEKKIGKEYNFKWEHGVDWAYWRGTWSKVPVSIYRNTVWFRVPHSYSWQSPDPIIQLMDSMKANSVAVDSELCDGIPSRPDTKILIDIVCKVHNPEQAQSLFDLFSIEFKEKMLEAQQNIWNEESLTQLPFVYDKPERFKNQQITLFDISLQNSSLEFTGLCIDFGDGKQGFINVIDYLKHHGCTDIVFTFREEDTVRPILE